MRYLIDGYNLIGQMDHIQLSDIDKEEKLAVYLNKHSNIKDRFEIIFDGHRENPEYGNRSVNNRVTSFFTPSDQSADDYIKDKCETKQNKSGWMLVTSDNDILAHAKHNNVSTIKSEDFIKGWQKEG